MNNNLRDTIEDFFFKKETRKLTEQQEQLLEKNIIKVDWFKPTKDSCEVPPLGILFGEDILEYQSPSWIKHLRTQYPGTRVMPPAPEFLDETRDLIERKHEVASQIEFFTNYIFSVLTTFPNPEQHSELMPTGFFCEPLNNDREIKSQETVAAFIRDNRNYIKKIKARMLLQLIQGEQ